MYIYIYMVPPPHVPTPLCLNLSLREAWVRGIPLSPSLSPKSQVQDGVGVWDWGGECLQIVTLFFHVWRVPSKIAPNHPNHFRIILIRARPWIQDPRSKIAHRSCAGNLGSNAQPNHPNHFRFILIRARPWIQDPRSKIAQGSCQGILHPTLTRWIQDSLARPLGNLGSWILDPGPGPNQNDSEMIRMIRLSIGSKIARAKPLCNLGSWILDPGPNDSDDSVSLLLIRHLYCHDSYNIWSFMKYASHYFPQNTF